jgi:protein-L-isoaspartate(D-aspartate) O-methyltransferase
MADTTAETTPAAAATLQICDQSMYGRYRAGAPHGGTPSPPGSHASVWVDPFAALAPQGVSLLSSLSAPVMHAGNLHQAQIQEGQRVLEIGSGGPNAAMLAHLVGPTGMVVSVDIDEGVTARTRAALECLGLADRVEVVTADAFEPLGLGVFDRIMVTVSPWSLPQTWVEQLASDGILVVPLQLSPGLQRVIGFRKRDGRLISESTVPGGFVPLQGAGLFNPPSARLTGPSGKPVTFRFASEVPEWFGVSDDVLASDPVEAWSDVTYENGTIWLDLLTYLLVQPDACSMDAEDPADRGSDKSFYPALVDGESFAALRYRPFTETTVQVGAIGKGPDAARLTRRLADTIAWYGAAHRGAEPLFQWWPTGTEPGDIPPSVTVLPRPHGTLTLSWPVVNGHQ